MFNRLILLTFILSNYLTFAEEIIVNPAMSQSGKIEITSPTATKITFLDGDYSALKSIFARNNVMLTTLTIPDSLTDLEEIWVGNNAKLINLTIPTGLTSLEVFSAYANPMLTNITISAGLTSLEVISVHGNPMLTTLTINAGLTALKYIFANDNFMLTTLTMENALVNRSHQLALITPRTPETLAAAAIIQSLSFETEDVTVAADHGDQAIVGQEALTTLRAKILGKWTDFKISNAALVDELLPKAEDPPKAFDEIYPQFSEKLKYLIHVKSKKEAIRLHLALDGLKLLNGDLSIPTYQETTRANYRTTYADGMPNNLQIFILLYRIAERNIITHKEYFVRNWLAGTFETNFAGFKAYYPKYAGYSSLGEVLNEHNPEGEKLVQVLAKILDGENHTDAEKVLGSHIPKDVIKMAKRYQITQHEESLNPIIEALFMTLRGHNNKLFDSGEVHKPACPFGSYLQMLRALSDPSFALHGAEAFGGVEIITCAP